MRRTHRAELVADEIGDARNAEWLATAYPAAIRTKIEERANDSVKSRRERGECRGSQERLGWQNGARSLGRRAIQQSIPCFRILEGSRNPPQTSPPSPNPPAHF